jgi:DNA-binding transcriptional LysR family regulator
MKFTLRQLAVFEAVARLGSVSAAAEEVALSQSAASLALQDLEATLGAALFHRHRKKLTLNENGRRLQPQAISILRQAREIELQSAGSNLAGAVRIAATSTIGNYLMPDISAAFLAEHPNAMMKLAIMSEPEVIEQVEAMNVDLGFIEGLTMRHTVAVEPWLADGLVPVAAPGHWACGKRLKPDDLAGERWILLPVGSFTRHLFVTRYAAQLRAGTIVCESNSIESMKRLVRAGGGISCLSRSSVADELAQGSLVELVVEGFPIEQRFSLIARRDIFQGGLQQSFARHAHALVQAHPASERPNMW